MRIVMSQGGYQGFRRISRQEASSALLALASMATWRNHKALRNVSFKPYPTPSNRSMLKASQETSVLPFRMRSATTRPTRGANRIPLRP